MPFADRLGAGIVKTALNLKDDILAEDFTNSLRSGTSALITALEIVSSGERKQILVTATDKREAKAAYFYEMWFGDGAASMLVGTEGVIAEFLGSFTVTHDFVDHYRGEVAFADHEVGRLLDALPDDGLVVLTSDHGEEFKEHGGWTHGNRAYQEQLCIPLLIKPGRGWNVEPGELSHRAQLSDLAPTLCALLDLEVPQEMTGRCLVASAPPPSSS